MYVLFVWFHGDDAETVMNRFREWAESAPRHVGALPFVGHVPELEEFPQETWGEPTLAILGSSRGNLEEAEGVFRPLTEDLAPIADFSGPMPFEDLQRMLDEDYPDGMRYYWKSIYLTELTDEAVDVMLRYNESAPSDLSTIDVWCLGGAIDDVARDATAFWHRDKPYMITFEANWEDADADDANVDWACAGFAEMESLPVTSGRYGNFPGMAEDPARLLFGENYDRLIDVKTKYDPGNLFHLNQNVEPRAAGD